MEFHENNENPTPTRAQPASETPRTHPHVTPKDHHGTKGFFEFGFVEKLLRVLGASSTLVPLVPLVVVPGWLACLLYCIIL